MNHLTDICCKKLSTTFIPKDQGQWSDDIATATPNLQTESWVLFNEVYFVSQQCVNQSEGVITRLIHVRVSSYESDRCAATAGGCNLPWRLLTTCNRNRRRTSWFNNQAPETKTRMPGINISLAPFLACQVIEECWQEKLVQINTTNPFRMCTIQTVHTENGDCRRYYILDIISQLQSPIFNCSPMIVKTQKWVYYAQQVTAPSTKCNICCPIPVS